MPDQPEFVSAYLLSPVRTLGEACREVGRDECGRRCPSCPLRELCQNEARWLVQRSAPPASLV
jgi:hypothetical protein